MAAPLMRRRESAPAKTIRVPAAPPKKEIDVEAVVESLPTEGLSHELLADIQRAWNLSPDPPIKGCNCKLCKPDRVPLPDEDATRMAKLMPVLEVVRRLGLGEPKRRGRDHYVRCPLHKDSKPSMRINPEKGLWYCDPCGVGGDGIELVMRAESLSFPEAVRFLAGD